MIKLTLPTDSEARKDVPLLSGCMNYAPAALAWFARISVKGDRKHNPENAGNPPFHARGKSMDHGDCIVRHTIDIEDLKAAIRRDGSGGLHPSPVMVHQLLEEAAYRFWRAGIELQELCERYEGAPLAPAARLPEGQQTQSAFAAQVQSEYEANKQHLEHQRGLEKAAGMGLIPTRGNLAKARTDEELKRAGEQYVDERYGNGY